jgi:S-adenosylmethionine synthetase
MANAISRTAEHVSAGHPDKFCDQVADRILDEVLTLCQPKGDEILEKARTAVECLAKDNLLMISGEVNFPAEVRGALDVQKLAREVWEAVGYGDADQLTVVDHIQRQSPDIAEGLEVESDDDGTRTAPVNEGGAGDQGIMVGYATAETPEMMPREWVLARNLCKKLKQQRVSGEIPWLRCDCKSQVTLGADGAVQSVIIAAQHAEKVDGVPLDLKEITKTLLERVVWPELGDVSPEKVLINGTGKFTIGGPIGDAGVVGRKIVVDAYGPRVPVGGGAYSGKDPSKVDRSAAYMCRYIAKTVVATQIARECTVTLAYGIGGLEPEMVTAVTDTGENVWDKVRDRFPDLSPRGIIRRLSLLRPDGWSYYQTASYGHYGRPEFPWEQVNGVA